MDQPSAGAGALPLPFGLQGGRPLKAATSAGSAPGTYVLLLELDRSRRLVIGRLGQLHFSAGWYLYVGSAFGPGGVKARCGHHCRLSAKPRWHVDYLRAVAVLREIWFTHDSRRREHQWAELLAAGWVKLRSVKGFGATDCDCPSHLFHHHVRPDFHWFRHAALTKLPDQEVIFCEQPRSGQE